ncbi:MAG: hypothetical protein ACM3VS_17670 [Candidatus Dadabacteria bacterium]
MKQLITYQFPSVAVLLAFIHEIHATRYEIDAHQRMLTCECDEEEVNLATIHYHAKVIHLVKETA